MLFSPSPPMEGWPERPGWLCIASVSYSVPKRNHPTGIRLHPSMGGEFGEDLRIYSLLYFPLPRTIAKISVKHIDFFDISCNEANNQNII
jgi:hypothetical protein